MGLICPAPKDAPTLQRAVLWPLTPGLEYSALAAGMDLGLS